MWKWWTAKMPKKNEEKKPIEKNKTTYAQDRCLNLSLNSTGNHGNAWYWNSLKLL